MHRARVFFYVAAGMFLLALSYHLGAQQVGAQTAGTVQGIGIADQWVTGAVGHQLYEALLATPGDGTAILEPVPGTAPVVSTLRLGSGDRQYAAVLENGEMYAYISSAAQWQYVGNLIGGPVPAQRESFGAMKSRYRGERGAGQSGQGH